jgi:methionyl-tRNA formyltransferase
MPRVPAAVAQPEEGALHAPKLEKSEGQIDWTMSGTEVLNHVRGMDPWPGAYAARGDARVRLFGARRGAIDLPAGIAPGTVLGLTDGGLEVACGTGSVVFCELQAAGKRRMPAGAYAQGHAFAEGERLA